MRLFRVIFTEHMTQIYRVCCQTNDNKRTNKKQEEAHSVVIERYCGVEWFFREINVTIDG